MTLHLSTGKDGRHEPMMNSASCRPVLRHADRGSGVGGPPDVPVGGQHPPVAGGVSPGARAPVQGAAVPASHGGGGLDPHAPPLRLGAHQVPGTPEEEPRLASAKLTACCLSVWSSVLS